MIRLVVIISALFLVASAAAAQDQAVGQTYTVRYGDTLYSIAMRYGVTIAEPGGSQQYHVHMAHRHRASAGHSGA
ncbi:MAG: LysM peptidoglycan-binding domain-containing protein [Chloroflexi bacterium]|nr:LysM peptidoglycan-binding domain-containing protein [Chloroflexota bacterium]